MANQKEQDFENYLKKAAKLTPEDVLSIPSIGDNPISSLLINLYTKEGKLMTPDLLNDLRLFVSQTSLDTKLKFLFKIYDMDCDGFVTYTELFQIIDLLCEERIERRKMLNLVDQSFKSIKTQKIGFEEFSKLIMSRTKNIETYFMTESK